MSEYDSFGEIDFLRDFMLKNGVEVNVVELFIETHFLEINAVAKSLDGSDLAVLDGHPMQYISTFLSSSDIDLAGDGNTVNEDIQ